MFSISSHYSRKWYNQVIQSLFIEELFLIYTPCRRKISNNGFTDVIFWTPKGFYIFNINIPFKTDYGQIILDSLGYTDGHLILAVDASGYYKTPVLYLRDTDTNGLYGRDDGFVSVSRDNLQLYSFSVTSEMLDRLEIVMPEEYHFTFPLMYTNKTKTINLSDKNMTVNNSTIIKEIKLSPLSMTITGTVPSGHETGFLYSDCSIIMKDGRSLSVFKGGSGGYHGSEFSINMPFEAPVEIETIKALVIKPAGSSMSTQIPLN